MQIALAGIGKIALDQHVPALAASPEWQLVATLSRQGRVPGVPSYDSLDALLEAHPGVQAVSLCLPPVPRAALAQDCLRAGRHVMLEKPPGASLAEVQGLEALAVEGGRTLYATWHSRMAPGVEPARRWLADKGVRQGRITWREDVRHWHPGQDWVFEPGGMGVFDPGINALSILTRILPRPVHLLDAGLEIPANRQTPIAAKLRFSDQITADFDWRQEGPQTWDIEIDTDSGRLALRQGGALLEIDGQPVPDDGPGEYPALYARMAQLVRDGAREVDLAPMILVSDALALGRRTTVAPFDWSHQP